jgi:uncharacterized protein (TIGR03118 family)
MSRYLCCFLVLLTMTSVAEALDFGTINLVTDNQSVNSAQITDPSLVNAWGIAFNTSGPAWVSDNGSGVATIYSVTPPPTSTVTKVGLTVTIPGDGTVTGQAFNSDAAAFGGDHFLFVNEDGTISGWISGTSATTIQTASTSNVYKGTTLASVSGNTYLYAANFRAGTIDVIKGTAAAPNLAGTFTDPNLPAGYAPFNIQNLAGNLYVTYAVQDGTKHDEVAGAGLGIVDVFDAQGNLMHRVATAGALNAPWGLAIAPSNFGVFAGDLLVGNFGDGKINVYEPSQTNDLEGQLTVPGGQPLAIDGLWALSVGAGANDQTLFFTAGPVNESHGLFGIIAPVPEPSTAILLGLGVLGLVTYSSRKRKNS